MTQQLQRDVPGSEWRGLYRVGAVAALLVVILSVLDVGLSILSGAPAATPGSLDATHWFAALQANWFDGLRNLGIVNVATTTLSLPIFAALAALLWPRERVLLILAGMLLVVGVAVYLANNNALAMLALSPAYLAADAEAQRTLLAAGQAMLSAGEDLTPGTYFGFLYTEVAGLLLVLAVFRSRVFGRALPLIAVAGFLMLIAFSTLAAFVPSVYQWTVIAGTAAGLPMIVWYTGLALRLWRLSAARPA